ncbi:MAG TPA: ParB/RepB/Spo0J family partition protein [Bacteroidales bacterium]|nr:ParB/RepB/Spo0J family partition protein [Bacteroidales bacterium]HPS71375.1 ParB/RepB/Spo0J family partition protein [Bacteroidales bacterium]
MEKKTPNRLGRGLGTLLGGAEIPVVADTIVNAKSDPGTLIKIDSIEINPHQPRVDFDQKSLEDLAISIRTYGLIQPITVRPITHGKYQLISGERRFRASKMAGLTEIPAYVRTADDLLSLQMALVENVQRENLNAIEIAVSYQRLLEECELSHEELSNKVGKDRTTITNYLRLLKLSRDAQIAVRDKKISMGHARAIITIEDDILQSKIVKEIISGELSVRQTESLVKKYNVSNSKLKTKVKINISDQLVNFSTELSKKLNTRVKISKELSGKGKISIPFGSEEELNKIIERLNNL